MEKQMFGRDLYSGRTTLVDYIDGHDAATVIVKKPPKGSTTNAANWHIHSRTREPRNRLFFQFLHDSPLPQTDKYVEDGGKRAFTVTAEGNKGWWVQHKYQNTGSFTIPGTLRFKIADSDPTWQPSSVSSLSERPLSIAPSLSGPTTQPPTQRRHGPGLPPLWGYERPAAALVA